MQKKLFMVYQKMHYMLLHLHKPLQLKKDLGELKKLLMFYQKNRSCYMENFLIVLSQIVQGGEKDLVKFATQA